MGRFGLHLLKYWVDNYDNAQFDINYINDDYLDFESFQKVLRTDKHIRMDELEFVDNQLIVHLPKGDHFITYTHESADHIPWFPEVDLFMECSGKLTENSKWDKMLKHVKYVIISATSWTADQILVYGFNHENHDSRIISYGSCTVNAYIPLAAEIDTLFGIKDSDVNIIHNVPTRNLGHFDTLERKACTLEMVAPHLLPFITSSNFKVNYTLVPYDGVSIMDYRFRLKRKPHKAELYKALDRLIQTGQLKNLYRTVPVDNGPDEHKFSPYSAVIIRDSIVMKDDSLYLSAYFDNENSANRYFDLVNYLCQKT